MTPGLLWAPIANDRMVVDDRLRLVLLPTLTECEAFLTDQRLWSCAWLVNSACRPGQQPHLACGRVDALWLQQLRDARPLTHAEYDTAEDALAAMLRKQRLFMPLIPPIQTHAIPPGV